MDSIRINTKDIGTVCGGFRPAQLSRTNGHRPYRVKAVGETPAGKVGIVSFACAAIGLILIGCCMVLALVFPGNFGVM